MLHVYGETISHSAIIHKYSGRDRNVIKLRLNSKFIAYNIGKIYTSDIFEKIDDINEYNDISDLLVNVIIKSLGRAILIYGIQDDTSEIVTSACSSLDNFIINKSLVSYIEPTIFDVENTVLTKIIELVIDEFRNDFNKLTGKDVTNVEDAFSMYSEEYVTSDYGIFKFSEDNIISILEL